MLGSQSLETFVQWTATKIGASADHQSRRFPTGMGIDDPDCFAITIAHSLTNLGLGFQGLAWLTFS